MEDFSPTWGGHEIDPYPCTCKPDAKQRNFRVKRPGQPDVFLATRCGDTSNLSNSNLEARIIAGRDLPDHLCTNTNCNEMHKSVAVLLTGGAPNEVPLDAHCEGGGYL